MNRTMIQEIWDSNTIEEIHRPEKNIFRWTKGSGSEFLLERYVALDLETTGLSPDWDDIIEIGLIKVEGGRVVDSLHSLVRPEKKLPLKIKELTGIDEEMLAGAPRFEQLEESVLSFVEGENILGHCIGFDMGFLERALGKPLPNSRYDTLELARTLMPTASSHSLPDLCARLGFAASFHRAMDDARAVIFLYDKLAEYLRQLDGNVLAYLPAFLERAGSPWSEVISGLSGVSRGLNVFEQHFSPGGEEGREFYRRSGVKGYVDPEEVRNILSGAGMLAGGMPSFETRHGQIQMSVEVARTFNEERFLLVEAGTGTGKSLAYLVPALLWAAGGGPRVVIATKTINLQDQLWYRDIPMVKECLGIDVKTALAKGRSNYLCMRKWAASLSEGRWTGPEALFLARILVWANETSSGDKIEVNLGFQEEEMWINICADSYSCMGSGCRYYPGRCFVARAKREAESSGVIVTNHALLFSDIKTGNMVLPAFGPLVIDEAHHLEDAATEQLGKHVSRGDMRRWLNRSGRLVSKSWETAPPSDQDIWMNCLVGVREETGRLRSTADQFFAAAGSFVLRGKGSAEGDHHSYRIRSEDISGDGSGLPWGELSNLIFRTRTVLEGLRKITELLSGWAAEDESWSEKAKDYVQAVSLGEEMLDCLEFVYGYSDQSFVYWISVSGQGEWRHVSLNASPVRVGELLYDRLFSCAGPVVMTSATLTTNGSFDFFAERVGIDRVAAIKVAKSTIESPFEYEKQALLCLVNSLPLQGPEAGRKYLLETGAALEELVMELGGRTLVLFTSHRVLREVYGYLKSSLEEKGISVLGHNIDGNRSRLVEDFIRLKKSVLMGTASFWEGIDIPGESLSSVIMVKLPFPSPSAPVIEARIEDLNALGRSSFGDYYLPMAVIRFKQGFGRLIRTERDRGVVVVLDRRLAEKGYGRKFLGSLPLKSHFRGDLSAVRNKISEWLAGVAGNLNQ